MFLEYFIVYLFYVILLLLVACKQPLVSFVKVKSVYSRESTADKNHWSEIT